MNRFQVLKDRAADFEAMWLGRDSDLPNNAGFVEFRLLKGPEHEDHILYSSHTFWESEDDFRAWTKSDSFRKAHQRANTNNAAPMTLGHPQFEGFETIQQLGND
jgi:heme-degrading monooxygenase HmoA